VRVFDVGRQRQLVHLWLHDRVDDLGGHGPVGEGLGRGRRGGLRVGAGDESLLPALGSGGAPLFLLPASELGREPLGSPARRLPVRRL
jgi:hypothetical protein